MFCLHSNTTWPQTPRGNAFAKPHVTCVTCGAEFRYDWAAMKRGARIEVKPLPVAVRREVPLEV